MPVTSANCPKCGHKEAYFWTSQTRSGDEASTLFMNCLVCGKKWKQ